MFGKCNFILKKLCQKQAKLYFLPITLFIEFVSECLKKKSNQVNLLVNRKSDKSIPVKLHLPFKAIGGSGHFFAPKLKCV